MEEVSDVRLPDLGSGVEGVELEEGVLEQEVGGRVAVADGDAASFLEERQRGRPSCPTDVSETKSSERREFASIRRT